MAIAFVNSDRGENYGGGEDTFVSSSGFANTAGNAIVVGIRFQDNDTTKSVTGVTDTAGNTYARLGSAFRAASSEELDIWMALNIASHANNVVTATFSNGVAYRTVLPHQFSGFATTGTLYDTRITVEGTSGTLTTAAGLSTADNNELIFAIFTIAASGVTWTAGSVGGNAFTKRQEDSFTVAGCQTYVTSSALSSATASIQCSDGSTAKCMLVVAIKESAGGGGGGTPNPWNYYANQ